MLFLHKRCILKLPPGERGQAGATGIFPPAKLSQYDTYLVENRKKKRSERNDRYEGTDLGTGAGVQRHDPGVAARTIQEVVGGTVHNTYNSHQSWYVKAPDGRKWKVMGDASVHIISGGRGRRGEACEFVTPICTYEDIPLMQDCIRALRKAGAKVNNSCGLHIHIWADKHTAQSLKNLVFTWRAKQELIYRAVGTQPHRLKRWCLPIDDNLVQQLQAIPGKQLDRATLEDTWYTTYSRPTENRNQHYNSSRYHALNLHSTWQRGTVEFRCFEATTHTGEIRAYLNLCLAMSAQAINSKRTSAEVLDNGNDKYAMRCFLLRLGFIGDEWKTVREHLLKRLSGNAAWRNDPNTYESYRARRSA